MAEIGFWHYADQNPDKLALVDPEGKEWSNREFLDEINRISHGLRALGLKEGDAVAVAMPNCAEYVAMNLAITQIGMYMVPINWHLTGAEVAYIVSDSGARVFCSHERIAEAAIKANEEAKVENTFSIGDIDGFRAYSELTAGQATSIPDNRTAGATMNYTSGTTGKPKAVKRPLKGLPPEQQAAMSTGIFLMFGMQSEDNNVHYTGSPLYHTAPMAWASIAMHMHHPLILADKWDGEEMLQLIGKYKITSSHMVPTQFIRLLKLPEDVREKYDISSTRYMVHAAAPCPPEIKKAMFDWWGPCICEYYAATEGGGAYATPQDWLKYPGTVGKKWPNSDIKIYDDDAKELPAGEQGTIYMRLPEGSDFEYKGDKAKTAKERIANYFTVGDIGYLNEDGFLFLCDRKIDMIISGGANIYPAEIENSLILHPKVDDCAVFGIPNPDWGEEIKAVVQPGEGVTGDDALSQEIMEFLETQIARMKLPKSIDYLDELPRDPNGKLYKRRLRDPYWENQQRKV